LFHANIKKKKDKFWKCLIPEYLVESIDVPIGKKIVLQIIINKI